METDKGFLVLTRAGDIRFAAGLATNDAIAQAMVRRWRQTDAQGRAILTVEVQGQHYSAVVISSEEAVAFVMHRHPDRDVLFEFAATVEFAGDIFRQVLTNPYDAMAVVDRQGLMRFLSPVHEHELGLGRGEAAGRHVTEVIENSRLHEVARTGKAEVGALITMKGKTRVVTRIPITDPEGELVGAVGHIMFKGPEQLQSLSAEVIRLRSQLSSYKAELSSLRGRQRGLDQIVGTSAAIRQLKEQIARVAPLDVPVLLIGESGSGKELAAHAIHQLSKRREQTMVMINAAAMPASLVESELFGYEPGSFTGAEKKGRRGKFEQADKGTLFFDEIGDMPLEIQVKLLRVLQDGSFERVGGDKARHSNFRLISATNRNFASMIDSGEFRLDLFYRLSGVTIQLPALREHAQDIELLAEQALSEFARRHSTRIKRLGPGVIEFLQAQAWPGNVRQLMHAVEGAAIFAESDELTIQDFSRQGLQKQAAAEPAVLTDAAIALTAPASATLDVAAGSSVREAVGLVEENLIRESMKRHKGNKLRVAAELGISRSYLYKRLSETGLDWVRRAPVPAQTKPGSQP